MSYPDKLIQWTISSEEYYARYLAEEPEEIAHIIEALQSLDPDEVSNEPNILMAEVGLAVACYGLDPSWLKKVAVLYDVDVEHD